MVANQVLIRFVIRKNSMPNQKIHNLVIIVTLTNLHHSETGTELKPGCSLSMVRVAGEDGHGAVNLFCQLYAGNLVRPGHGPKSN